MILFQISKFVLATMRMRYCDAVLFLTAIYMSSRRPWDWTTKHFHSTFDVSSISYRIYFPFLIILFYNVLNIRLLVCNVSTLFKIWILVGTSQLLRRKKIWRTENLQTLKRLFNVADKQLFFLCIFSSDQTLNKARRPCRNMTFQGIVAIKNFERASV